MKFIVRTAVMACLVGMTSMASWVGAQTTVDGMGGFAMSPDYGTLVVAVPENTELVFFDTTAGKETRRVKLEFQPNLVAWQGKSIFAGQKTGGVIHILDAESGKEQAKATVGSTLKSLACSVKGPCVATNVNAEVYLLDSSGMSSPIAGAKGNFAAIDPKGEFVYTIYEGKVRTDLNKGAVKGLNATAAGGIQRVCNLNLWGVCVTPDGAQVGAIAGGGFDETGTRKRHYAIPMYDTKDMKTMVGEIGLSRNIAFHPVLPMAATVAGDGYQLVNYKSYAVLSKGAVGKGNGSLIAFGGKGRKLVYGGTVGQTTTLSFIDLALSADQQATIEKAIPK